MKALLVDIQRERRRQLRAALQSLDWNVEVIEVASGEEAGLIFVRQPVDLMVASVRLAGISGAELARRARQRSPGIKVILLENATDERLRDEAAGASADALLAWPVADDNFLAAVRRCMQTGDTASLAPQTAPPKVSLPIEFSLAQRLEALRVELDAQACLLLDSRLQMLGRAGNLPRSLEHEAFTGTAMDALQAAARVSSALGAGAFSGVLWIAAGNLDVYLAPVDPQAWLLVTCSALPAGDKAGQPARDVSHIQRAAAGLATRVMASEAKTSQQTVTPSVENNEAAPESPPLPDPKLEKLFTRGGRKRAKTQELDAYWDNQAEETSGSNEAMGDGSAISYEEARRRGLTPSDE